MFDAFVGLVQGMLLKAVVGLVGWRAWLANLAISYMVKLLKVLLAYVETRSEVKQALEKYRKVLNDPASTADDIRNAAPDFLK